MLLKFFKSRATKDIESIENFWENLPPVPDTWIYDEEAQTRMLYLGDGCMGEYYKDLDDSFVQWMIEKDLQVTSISPMDIDGHEKLEIKMASGYNQQKIQTFDAGDNMMGGFLEGIDQKINQWVNPDHNITLVGQYHAPCDGQSFLVVVTQPCDNGHKPVKVVKQEQSDEEKSLIMTDPCFGDKYALIY